MLQQRLARSLQSISRQPQIAHTCRTPPLRTANPASQFIAARRWYSSQNEEGNKTQEETMKNEGKGTQDAAKDEAAAKDESPVQKELEAKKKENVELTVSLALCAESRFIWQRRLTNLTGSVKASGCRVQKPPRADETRSEISKGLCASTIRQRPSR